MRILTLLIAAAALLLIPQKTSASTQTPNAHFTLILHQLRGPECCDSGDIKWFRHDLEHLEKNGLVGNFALRYDALQSDNYLSLVTKNDKNEYGALLEITPKLAEAAGVTYKSSPERWYEAQNVFLIGYTQEERKKIIDTYMDSYQNRLGSLPKFSSAWMIDAWSLAYLKEKYGIVAHQITREQFGTDSYTLYGGPVHYPYYPSSNWALIPQNGNTSMPLIMRQTIMDPVFVYGDKTDSYTSQPNDYALRDDTIEYFKHLFSQAHQQENPYTFALIGLENTMPESVQIEYAQQLEEVGKWQKKDSSNQTVTVSDFEAWYRQNYTQITSYEGVSHNDSGEKAWWITTPTYRARVRLSDSELSITDLRLYNNKFADPYLTTPAKSFGWWVVPFVLDGSRYFEGNADGSIVKNDLVKNRPPEIGAPIKLVLSSTANNVVLENEGSTKVLKNGTETVATFTQENIQLSQTTALDSLKNLPSPLHELTWKNDLGQLYWGFTFEKNILTPFVYVTDLDRARTEYKSLLFPEKQFDTLDVSQTSLYVNNSHSIAGRNPIRLVLFPKNKDGEAILLPSYPRVETTPRAEAVTFYEQHQNNGMIFIDIHNSEPLTSKVTVSHSGFESTVTVYFAPNCKEQKWHCLFHPQQAWWYIQSVLDDKARAKEAKEQKEALFVD